MSKKILFVLLILSAFSCNKEPLPEIYVGTVVNTYRSNLNPDQEEIESIETFPDTIIVLEDSEGIRFTYNFKDYTNVITYTAYISKDDIENLYIHIDDYDKRHTFFFSDENTLEMNYSYVNGIGGGFYSKKREFIGTKEE